MFETETESECYQGNDYIDSDISDNEETKHITSCSKAAFIVYWTSDSFAEKMLTFYLSDASYTNKSCFQRISIDCEIKMPKRP